MATLCLPPYRESYRRRFHPYPQYHRRVRQMNQAVLPWQMTVDAESVDERVWGDTEQGQGHAGVEEDRSDVAENGSREDLANLERVLFEETAEKPRGLATVVVELALFVTRALRRLCAS